MAAAGGEKRVKAKYAKIVTQSPLDEIGGQTVQGLTDIILGSFDGTLKKSAERVNSTLIGEQFSLCMRLRVAQCRAYMTSKTPGDARAKVYEYLSYRMPEDEQKKLVTSLWKDGILGSPMLTANSFYHLLALAVHGVLPIVQTSELLKEVQSETANHLGSYVTSGMDKDFLVWNFDLTDRAVVYAHYDGALDHTLASVTPGHKVVHCMMSWSTQRTPFENMAVALTPERHDDKIAGGAVSALSASAVPSYTVEGMQKLSAKFNKKESSQAVSRKVAQEKLKKEGLVSINKEESRSIPHFEYGKQNTAYYSSRAMQEWYRAYNDIYGGDVFDRPHKRYVVMEQFGDTDISNLAPGVVMFGVDYPIVIWSYINQVSEVVVDLGVMASAVRTLRACSRTTVVVLEGPGFSGKDVKSGSNPRIVCGQIISSINAVLSVGQSPVNLRSISHTVSQVLANDTLSEEQAKSAARAAKDKRLKVLDYRYLAHNALVKMLTDGIRKALREAQSVVYGVTYEVLNEISASGLKDLGVAVSNARHPFPFDIVVLIRVLGARTAKVLYSLEVTTIAYSKNADGTEFTLKDAAAKSLGMMTGHKRDQLGWGSNVASPMAILVIGTPESVLYSMQAPPLWNMATWHTAPIAELADCAQLAGLRPDGTKQPLCRSLCLADNSITMLYDIGLSQSARTENQGTLDLMPDSLRKALGVFLSPPDQEASDAILLAAIRSAALTSPRVAELRVAKYFTSSAGEAFEIFMPAFKSSCNISDLSARHRRTFVVGVPYLCQSLIGPEGTPMTAPEICRIVASKDPQFAELLAAVTDLCKMALIPVEKFLQGDIEEEVTLMLRSPGSQVVLNEYNQEDYVNKPKEGEILEVARLPGQIAGGAGCVVLSRGGVITASRCAQERAEFPQLTRYVRAYKAYMKRADYDHEEAQAGLPKQYLDPSPLLNFGEWLCQNESKENYQDFFAATLGGSDDTAFYSELFPDVQVSDAAAKVLMDRLRGFKLFWAAACAHQVLRKLLFADGHSSSRLPGGMQFQHMIGTNTLCLVGHRNNTGETASRRVHQILPAGLCKILFEEGLWAGTIRRVELAKGMVLVSRNLHTHATVQLVESQTYFLRTVAMMMICLTTPFWGPSVIRVCTDEPTRENMGSEAQPFPDLIHVTNRSFPSSDLLSASFVYPSDGKLSPQEVFSFGVEAGQVCSWARFTADQKESIMEEYLKHRYTALADSYEADAGLAFHPQRLLTAVILHCYTLVPDTGVELALTSLKSLTQGGAMTSVGPVGMIKKLKDCHVRSVMGGCIMTMVRHLYLSRLGILGKNAGQLFFSGLTSCASYSMVTSNAASLLTSYGVDMNSTSKQYSGAKALVDETAFKYNCEPGEGSVASALYLPACSPAQVADFLSRQANPEALAEKIRHDDGSPVADWTSTAVPCASKALMVHTPLRALADFLICVPSGLEAIRQADMLNLLNCGLIPATCVTKEDILLAEHIRKGLAKLYVVRVDDDVLVCFTSTCELPEDPYPGGSGSVSVTVRTMKGEESYMLITGQQFAEMCLEWRSIVYYSLTCLQGYPKNPSERIPKQLLEHCAKGGTLYKEGVPPPDDLAVLKLVMAQGRDFHVGASNAKKVTGVPQLLLSVAMSVLGEYKAQIADEGRKRAFVTKMHETSAFVTCNSSSAASGTGKGNTPKIVAAINVSTTRTSLLNVVQSLSETCAEKNVLGMSRSASLAAQCEMGLVNQSRTKDNETADRPFAIQPIPSVVLSQIAASLGQCLTAGEGVAVKVGDLLNSESSSANWAAHYKFSVDAVEAANVECEDLVNMLLDGRLSNMTHRDYSCQSIFALLGGNMLRPCIVKIQTDAEKQGNLLLLTLVTCVAKIFEGTSLEAMAKDILLLSAGMEWNRIVAIDGQVCMNVLLQGGAPTEEFLKTQKEFIARTERLANGAVVVSLGPGGNPGYFQATGGLGNLLATGLAMKLFCEWLEVQLPDDCYFAPTGPGYEDHVDANGMLTWKKVKELGLVERFACAHSQTYSDDMANSALIPDLRLNLVWNHFIHVAANMLNHKYKMDKTYNGLRDEIVSQPSNLEHPSSALMWPRSLSQFWAPDYDKCLVEFHSSTESMIQDACSNGVAIDIVLVLAKLRGALYNSSVGLHPSKAAKAGVPFRAIPTLLGGPRSFSITGVANLDQLARYSCIASESGFSEADKGLAYTAMHLHSMIHAESVREVLTVPGSMQNYSRVGIVGDAWFPLTRSSYNAQSAAYANLSGHMNLRAAIELGDIEALGAPTAPGIAALGARVNALSSARGVISLAQKQTAMLSVASQSVRLMQTVSYKTINRRGLPVERTAALYVRAKHLWLLLRALREGDWHITYDKVTPGAIYVVPVPPDSNGDSKFTSELDRAMQMDIVIPSVDPTMTAFTSMLDRTPAFCQLLSQILSMAPSVSVVQSIQEAVYTCRPRDINAPNLDREIGVVMAFAAKDAAAYVGLFSTTPSVAASAARILLAACPTLVGEMNVGDLEAHVKGFQALIPHIAHLWKKENSWSQVVLMASAQLTQYSRREISQVFAAPPADFYSLTTNAVKSLCAFVKIADYFEGGQVLEVAAEYVSRVKAHVDLVCGLRGVHADDPNFLEAILDGFIRSKDYLAVACLAWMHGLRVGSEQMNMNLDFLSSKISTTFPSQIEVTGVSFRTGSGFSAGIIRYKRPMTDQEKAKDKRKNVVRKSMLVLSAKAEEYLAVGGLELWLTKVGFAGGEVKATCELPFAYFGEAARGAFRKGHNVPGREVWIVTDIKCSEQQSGVEPKVQIAASKVAFGDMSIRQFRFSSVRDNMRKEKEIPYVVMRDLTKAIQCEGIPQFRIDQTDARRRGKSGLYVGSSMIYPSFLKYELPMHLDMQVELRQDNLAPGGSTLAEQEMSTFSLTISLASLFDAYHMCLGHIQSRATIARTKLEGPIPVITVRRAEYSVYFAQGGLMPAIPLTNIAAMLCINRTDTPYAYEAAEEGLEMMIGSGQLNYNFFPFLNGRTTVADTQGVTRAIALATDLPKVREALLLQAGQIDTSSEDRHLLGNGSWRAVLYADVLKEAKSYAETKLPVPGGQLEAYARALDASGEGFQVPTRRHRTKSGSSNASSKTATYDNEYPNTLGAPIPSDDEDYEPVFFKAEADPEESEEEPIYGPEATESEAESEPDQGEEEASVVGGGSDDSYATMQTGSIIDGVYTVDIAKREQIGKYLASSKESSTSARMQVISEYKAALEVTGHMHNTHVEYLSAAESGRCDVTLRKGDTHVVVKRGRDSVIERYFVAIHGIMSDFLSSNFPGKGSKAHQGRTVGAACEMTPASMVIESLNKYRTTSSFASCRMLQPELGPVLHTYGARALRLTAKIAPRDAQGQGATLRFSASLALAEIGMRTPLAVGSMAPDETTYARTYTEDALFDEQEAREEQEAIANQGAFEMQYAAPVAYDPEDDL